MFICKDRKEKLDDFIRNGLPAICIGLKFLATILKTHAALLDQLGRSAEAAKLRAEKEAL